VAKIEFKPIVKVGSDVKGERSCAFYKVMFDDKHLLNLQSNPWGACSVNLLSNFKMAFYKALNDDEFNELCAALGEFADTYGADSEGTFKAKRVLIQTTKAYVGYPLVKRFIEMGTKLAEFKNRSHNSHTNLLYMVDFGEDE